VHIFFPGTFTIAYILWKRILSGSNVGPIS
jgi:hypothetical protein